MATREIPFSDLSGQMIGNPDEERARIVVVDHPDMDHQVELDAMATELEPLAKLAVKEAVTIEVTMPGEEEPTRHVLTAANFNKLSTDRPMAEVLKDAKPVEVKKGLGRTALNGSGEKRNHETLEFAGFPHKGRTSPEEARLVRENLEQINKNLAAAGQRLIDPTNAEHKRRYGFDAAQTAIEVPETAPES